ncbi:MAG: HutD family protein [Rubrivivax sp.]|nr:HutD family protein [Rubrivivax sp.]
MTLRLISLADCAAQPWRNSGGRARELLAWPSADNWVLRISLADVERDGPFSAFPGVERWFAVVEGAGVRLNFSGRQLEVTPATPPLRFAGEAAPGCTLIDGPTRDLNFMVQRDRGRGWMRRARPGSAPAQGPVMGLYAADALECRFGEGASLDVPAGTLVWPGEAQIGGTLRGTPGARAWWIGFEPEATARPRPSGSY